MLDFETVMINHARDGLFYAWTRMGVRYRVRQNVSGPVLVVVTDMVRVPLLESMPRE